MLKGEGNICQRLFIDCFFYVLVSVESFIVFQFEVS